MIPRIVDAVRREQAAPSTAELHPEEIDRIILATYAALQHTPDISGQRIRKHIRTLIANIE